MTEESMSPVEVPRTSTESPNLLVMGAIVILIGYVAFGLIAGEFSLTSIYVALPLVAVLAAYKVLGVSISVEAQRIIGYIMGAVAVLLLLSDLRYNDFPGGAMAIIAYIVFIVGALMMFVGARNLSD